MTTTRPEARRLLVCLVLVALLAGCRQGSQGTPVAGGAPEPSPMPTSTPAVPTPTATPADGAGQVAALSYARQRLAERLDVAQDEIEVVSVEAVDWPDSGLGCAPPGHHVLEVVTAGYRVVLAHGGETYEYRSGGPTTPRLCERQAEAQGVARLSPGDVFELEAELVSIGNVPFTHLALSTPQGETFEVEDSPLAREAAQRPRQRRTWDVRVAGRGLVTPIRLEILAVRT